MKQSYINWKPGSRSMELVDKAQGILEEFNIRMTVRQLYYQLVATDVIPNHVKSYHRVVRILRNARMAGLLDWSWIEDRLRVPKIPSTWDSIGGIIEAAKNQFRMDRWADQDTHVEIWLEKDALAGICGDIASQWQVTLQVNRGYSSVSAMREAAQRLISKGRTKDVVIGYLGDHDPSGEDMVRDVEDRLSLFKANITVKKLAILSEDIEQFHLPPQPVKVTDSRAEAFRAAYGDDCVELDALRPDVLQQRIEEFVLDYLDIEQFKAVEAEEIRQRKSVKIGSSS